MQIILNPNEIITHLIAKIRNQNHVPILMN